jgi:hypothetical protein
MDKFFGPINREELLEWQAEREEMEMRGEAWWAEGQWFPSEDEYRSYLEVLADEEREEIEAIEFEDGDYAN